MFKFLRRYSKWILAIGGTLLLITFLIPYAFQGLGKMAATHGATWATVGPDGSSISVYDFSLMQREKHIAEILNPRLTIAQVHIDSVQHWYLLTHAAQEAGLIGGEQEARSMLGADPDTILANIHSQTGDSGDFILQTVAKYQGVYRMIRLFSAAGHFSDRRLREEAKELFHTVSAKFIAIPASADDVTTEPTEAEIDAQFEKYADDLPGEGDRGFGYKLPDRVKLEWVTVPADTVRALVEASPEYNDVALRKHWRANPDSKFPEVTDGALIPDIVRTDLAKVLFDKKMAEITREATDFLRTATRGLTREGSYYALPSDWAEKRPKLPQLALNLQEEFSIPLPSYTALGDRWLTADDVAKLEGIGTATTDRFGARPMPLPTIVRQLKEFGHAVDAVVQGGVAGPPLTGTDGSLYIFRITATDPTRRATSVDEVRDRVVADLKRVADYDSLVATQSADAAEAQKDGLMSLLLTNPRAQFFPQQSVSLAAIDNLSIQSQLGLPLTAMPSSLPLVGRDKDAVTAIINHAMALPMLTVEAMTPEQKIFSVPADDKLTLLIVEIVSNKPVTSEDYIRAVDMGLVQTLLLNQELDSGTAVTDSFSYASLAKRYDFKLSQSKEDEDMADAGDTKPGS